MRVAGRLEERASCDVLFISSSRHLTCPQEHVRHHHVRIAVGLARRRLLQKLAGERCARSRRELKLWRSTRVDLDVDLLADVLLGRAAGERASSGAAGAVEPVGRLGQPPRVIVAATGVRLNGVNSKPARRWWMFRQPT